MGLTYAIAIVLPVVATFFLVFGFLEDSGYIPRLAIFSDRLFRAMGLNGKAVLPMVLGLGCDTMATMTTRILGDAEGAADRDPAAGAGRAVLGAARDDHGHPRRHLVLGAAHAVRRRRSSQMVLVGFLAARVLPGDRSDFIMELPPMRMPRLRNLADQDARCACAGTSARRVPLFLVGTALLFVLDRVGGLGGDRERRRVRSSPALLGLPPKAAEVFVMGFLRRDYGAAGLFLMARDGQLTDVQAVVALTVMTLFVPCVANFLMIVKERGLRIGLAILAFVTVDGGRHRRRARTAR